MRYRLIDTAGSELEIIEHADVREDGDITLPDGRTSTVLEIYDDEDGREGGVDGTVVVDVD
jgi:hypothetical protein